jgi:hypothetical protein
LSLQENGEITSEDWDALRNAVKSLEHPSLAGRLTNIVGKPVELIGYAVPTFASEAITSATSKGLEAALKVALRTLRSSSSNIRSCGTGRSRPRRAPPAARSGWRRSCPASLLQVEVQQSASYFLQLRSDYDLSA